MDSYSATSIDAATRFNFSGRGWAAAKQAAENRGHKITPGAYVCQIIEVHVFKTQNDDVYIDLDVDIAEGEFTAYFYKRLQYYADWDFHAKARRYMFKGGKTTSGFSELIRLLEKQNSQFKFNENDFSPASLKGLMSGFTFGIKEREAADGELKEDVYIKFPCDLEEVRRGKVKTPPPERLKPKPQEAKKYDFADYDNTTIPDDKPW